MNRIAHLPRNAHSKPAGFGVDACVQMRRPAFGYRGMDTTG
jgi:hypothetical protein